MKTAIITGGTKGLGRELSLAFGKAGYYVLALYSADDSAGQKLSVDLAATGAAGSAVRHDVCSEDTALWNRTEIRDADNLALVHNACAAFAPAPMHQLSWSDFEKNFSVAVKGGWLCSQSLIRLMVKKRSAIVTVLTSAIEGMPPKGFTAYAVAKAGLQALTHALAVEYRSRGIKVFSVSPGYMDTPLTNQWEPRLREAIRHNSTRITVASEAAERVVNLIESQTVEGNGENYPV